MVVVCEFCGHSFSRESNLLTHMKTARYCLDKRGIQNTNHKCMGCNKGFGQKSNLERHQRSCISFYQFQIEEKDEEIRKKDVELAVLEKQKDKEMLSVKKQNEAEIIILRKKKDEKFALFEEKTVMKIAELENEITRLNLIIAESKGKISVYKERPSVVNNNTQYINPKLLQIKCDTIPPLTIENVKKEIASGKYTYDSFIRGESGLVDFIATMISDDDDQRSYVCTDVARNKFHRLIETREWENDNGATFLNKILDQLCNPTKDYYGKIINLTESKDESNRDLGEILMEKTKPMAMGITCPKSRDRNALFNRIRTEVRKLASV